MSECVCGHPDDSHLSPADVCLVDDCTCLGFEIEENRRVIYKPGIHEASADEYHGDPCPSPALSASIAAELVLKSPRHAWVAHPRLNPHYVREEKTIFDLGTAAHAYLLEGREAFEIIAADDWRAKDAREARDAARARGKVPLLADQASRVLAMCEAVNAQLDSFADPPRPFSGGKPERTIVWQEGDIWCRSRLDYLHDDFLWIDDFKTTGASANPDIWTRSALYGGPDIQAAFYLRGVKATTGKDARFRFVVAENFEPYACSVIELGPDALVIAEKKVRLAIELWTKALKEDNWPAYPTRTCYAALPPWEEARWLEKELSTLEG